VLDIKPKPYERYIVQWVTKFDSKQGHLQVVGFCVRDTGSSNWATLFQHEDEIVCRKVCEMLNEKEHNKC